MDHTASAALVPMVGRRFQSFAEAAEAALDAMGRSLPGAIVIAQFDPADDACRVTDVGGTPVAGLERGATLPVSEGVAGNGAGPTTGGSGANEWLDATLLRGMSAESWLVLPLELSDGKVAGLLCALSPQPAAYGPDHMALLGVAARVLSYEWERVSTRAELRELRNQVRDDQRTDAETGLANRDAFVTALDRDWRLAKRGTLSGVVVVCRVEVQGGEGPVGGPLATLVFKDVAAALAGTVRQTDQVGRTGPIELGAVLLGSDLVGAEAFERRFRGAAERATMARPVGVELRFGYQTLGEAESPGAAVEAAEEAARSDAAHAADATSAPPVPGL